MAVHLLLDTAVTGLPYVLPFLGVFVGFRLLDRIDLTLDGSFTLGAAVAGTLLVSGASAPVALVAAGLAGAAAGLVTTALHLLLRVPVLLAGIVAWIGLHSVNLRVMGRPTLALGDTRSLYAGFDGLDRVPRDLAVVGVLAAVVAVVLVGTGVLLRTEAGLALRATGANTPMARSQGVDDRAVVATGLAGANALAGLGGALVAQGQGFAEVNMGTGLLIAGVAAVLLGELVTRPTGSRVARALLAVVVGTLAYRLVLLAALRVGLPASDLRLVTATTLAAALLVKRLSTDRPRRRARRPRPSLGPSPTPVPVPVATNRNSHAAAR